MDPRQRGCCALQGPPGARVGSGGWGQKEPLASCFRLKAAPLSQTGDTACGQAWDAGPRRGRWHRPTEMNLNCVQPSRGGCVRAPAPKDRRSRRSVTASPRRAWDGDRVVPVCPRGLGPPRAALRESYLLSPTSREPTGGSASAQAPRGPPVPRTDSAPLPRPPIVPPRGPGRRRLPWVVP